MGLTYHYSFRAPATTSADALTTFLRTAEKEAQTLGFSPTLVLTADFDSGPRLEFARRLTTGIPVELPALKGSRHPAGVWHLDPDTGACRIAPQKGVVLVLTDRAGGELVFGFFRFPRSVDDGTGQKISTGLTQDWLFSDHQKSADPRLRSIVASFAKGGFLESEIDEFAEPTGREAGQ